MRKIKKELKLNSKPDKIFRKFVEGINEWWPKNYTWSQDKLVEISIEQKKDGLCTEIGPHGFRCDWGRIVDLVENKKIEIMWQIGPKREPVPDPDKASVIKINFKLDENSGTLLEFEHGEFENHGDGAEEYFQMMNSPYGWDHILSSFGNYCES